MSFPPSWTPPACLPADAPFPFPLPPAVQVPVDQREVVLDSRTDDFYRKHMYDNYGEIGASVKQMLESFQTTSSRHKQVGGASATAGALGPAVSTTAIGPV